MSVPPCWSDTVWNTLPDIPPDKRNDAPADPALMVSTPPVAVPA
jgi:hypothetical protein